jgi:6-pyruvoyltetrahydropterin/6-carboxytetrahydropterin synthase
MGKWDISKEFEFDYGHRVWTQTLDEKLALTTCTKCRWPHGHRGKVVVHLDATELKNDMVMDFVELNWFKKFIDDTIDHKCILDIHDPILGKFYPILKDFDGWNPEDVDQAFEYHPSSCHFTIWKDLYSELSAHEKEVYEGLVFVSFVPTSENLSKWLFDIVQDRLKGLATVSHIEFHETPKSKSVYYG